MQLSAVLGALALVLGYVEHAFFTTYYVPAAGLFVLVLMAAAAGLVRVLPSVALAVMWVLALTHLLTGTPVMFTELAVVGMVAYGVGRWGSTATAVAAGVSIPTILVLAVGAYVLGVAAFSSYDLLDVMREGAFARRGLFGGLVLSLAVLGLPFLTGLALRSQATATDSRRGEVAAQAETARAVVDAEQAQEIARLREEQARLARDVHDVVGHSLAVILAQAESGQFLPDDPAQLKATLATIATSARSSLRDVRQVLSATTPTPAPSGAMQTLVEGIRSGGRVVDLDEVGTPRPLPPELEVVSHRVLQEMLTNAVKHGVRDQPIRVERHWPAGGLERDLRLEVTNSEPVDDETQPISAVPAGSADGSPDGQDGQGLDGMRRRLESVGGRLDVRRRAGSFTVTAWVPVSPRG